MILFSFAGYMDDRQSIMERQSRILRNARTLSQLRHGFPNRLGAPLQEPVDLQIADTAGLAGTLGFFMSAVAPDFCRICNTNVNERRGVVFLLLQFHVAYATQTS